MNLADSLREIGAMRSWSVELLVLLPAVLEKRPKSLFVFCMSGRDKDGERIGRSRLVVPAVGDEGSEADAWLERICDSWFAESRWSKVGGVTSPLLLDRSTRAPGAGWQ